MIPKNTIFKSKNTVLRQQRAGLKSNLIHQCKILLPTLLKIYLPLVWILVIIKWQNIIPTENLTKDPLAVADNPFYFGILSQVGALFWCSCAAICFFSTILLTKIHQTKLILFFFFSGCLTTALLLDDLFLLHEFVLPTYLKIPEKVVYLIYVIFVFLYLINFRRIIQSTEFIVLVLAFAFFGFSVSIDSSLISIPKSWIGNKDIYFIEDGSKFLGIISWFTYFIRTCLIQIEQGWYQRVKITE
ncbi:MAG: hypothetical protein KME05_13790 [Gloeocapsa sp. UFS-A4-WI-NPMV-4B04]|jgi:hypothetical protein|nr:hypothetical protein [Gloeocapsa sp. UFS-A4-WI-NPMV-4B04]